MRVAVYPADDTGCGWYRLRWPAMALRQAGAPVEVREIMRATELRDDTGQPDFVRVRDLEDIDVVVMQRPVERVYLLALRDIRSQGVRVVVEIDDDFANLPANHPVRLHDPRGLHRQVLSQCCREADMVTVSTPALARRYGTHGRCRVVPNRVPAYYLRLARPPGGEEGPPILGWGGPTTMHISDLEEVGLAVAQALERTGARFRAIGDRAILTRFGVEGEVIPWQKLPTMDYARAVASLDVGMVPLRINAFNEAKSSLKGTEMAALGVPFVASPTSEYRALAALGVGVLASRPREWRRELVRLLSDGGYRDEMRGRGREAALSLTIEGDVGRWWAAWRAAFEQPRIGSAPVLCASPDRVAS